MKVRIGRYHPEVYSVGDLHASIVSFSAGEHGQREAGEYAFWTAWLREAVEERRKVTARAQVGLDAGERFRRMGMEMRNASSASDRKEYRVIWEKMLRRGANVERVEPSSLEAVRYWLERHPQDSPFVQWGWIGGEMLTAGDLIVT